ncbi:MAG TPA: type VI immunity family protein, partial [Myxococcaceae bacterium]
MSEHYPQIRIKTVSGYTRIREGLSLTFYLPPRHPEYAEDVLRALELYLRYTGPGVLRLYADTEGDWQDLDEAGWSLIRRKIQERKSPQADLEEGEPIGNRYAFYYRGKDETFVAEMNEPEAMCEVIFWLPTEYLKEHGPGRVRELAVELATLLPVRSGYCGLSFNGDLDLAGMDSKLLPYWKRYPGIDIPSPFGYSWDMGKRLRGPHWVNFLGQPVLGELGGVLGLREQLKHPETTVQELPGDKAVITLGPWPEAGDMEKGEVLPAYRELARVLEPWLYQSEVSMLHQSKEETRRWE